MQDRHFQFSYQNLLGFAAHLWAQFHRNQGLLNAAAMTYTTLFAVVPLMTVSYAMLASVPSFQGVGPQLESLIFDNFVPSTGAVVKEYLSGFASQARSLTLVGVGFLVVTAYLMLKSIEKTFNRIWQVREPRRGLSSFLLYWAVLSLGPVLLGMGLVLTSYVTSLTLIEEVAGVVGGKQRLLMALPLLLSSAAFTLLYAAVPHCRVPLRHAFAGGLLSALLFELAKRGFALFVALSPSYQLIYGAFAAVPLFLFWVYISWIIVLLGAEFVRALSTYEADQAESEPPGFIRGLQLLALLWQAQQSGKGRSAGQLKRLLGAVPVLSLYRYLDGLMEAGMISRDRQGDYLLVRDLHCLNLEQYAQAVRWPVPVLRSKEPAEQFSQPLWLAGLEALLKESGKQRAGLFAPSLASLFSETEGNQQSPCALELKSNDR